MKTLSVMGLRTGFAGLLTMLGVGLLPGPVRAEDKVVVAHAAGINGQAVDKLLKDFTAETGMAAEGITFSDTDYGAKLQLVARAGNPAFDVALGLPLDVYALTRSTAIYAPLDTSAWQPATLAAMREAHLIASDYAVSQDTAALLVYSAKLSIAPQTWGDFFDTDKIPGNRGMASGGLGVPINLDYAMIASGGAPDKVNPLDYDAVFKLLGKLGPKLVLWDNAPKGIQDVVNGDTVMTWSYAPAALSALAAGQQIKIATPPGTIVARQIAVVLSKAPDSTKAGQRFLTGGTSPTCRSNMHNTPTTASSFRPRPSWRSSRPSSRATCRSPGRTPATSRRSTTAISAKRGRADRATSPTL